VNTYLLEKLLHGRPTCKDFLEFTTEQKAHS